MIARLHEAVAAVAPIFGVGIGPAPKYAVTIHFDNATAQQQANAQAVVAAFDRSQGAEDLWQSRRKQRTIGNIHAVRLGSDRTNNTTSFADCTGLSFDLAPDSHYAFEFTGAYNAAAGTTGLQLALDGPASPVLLRAVGQICTSATAVINGGIIAYDSGINATASGGATPLPFFLKGNISTGRNGGAFTLRFRSEIAGSQVQIFSGSYGLLFGVS